MKRKVDYRAIVALLLALIFVAEPMFPGICVKADEILRRETATGYVDIDFSDSEDEVISPENSSYSLSGTKEGEGLPAVYRSDQVSDNSVSANGAAVSYLPDSMRNQNPFGTCWAFSALGACEASMIRKGLADNSIDLSERHLVYYFYNKKELGDTFGGTTGDYNEAVMEGHSYLSQGSNNQLTLWHLVSWCGPVVESAAPYSGLVASADADMNGLMGQENSAHMAYESDACHVQNAYILPVGDMYSETGRARKDRIKRLIMEYGALSMSYYSVTSPDCDSLIYDSYYNSTYSGTNHAVQVVGWDDTFPKGNFAKEAPGDGAWLMKNSWGEPENAATECGQHGYFWISYYDTSINNNDPGETPKYAFVFDADSPDNYDYIHQYDGDGGNGSYRTLAAANRFTAGTPEGDWESLKAVGIGINRSNVLCRVEIYKDLKSPRQDPVSGELVATKETRLDYLGYHTIPLDEEILLPPGCEYSVVFRFPELGEGEKIPLFISTDRKYTVNKSPFINVKTFDNPNVSFYLAEDNSWKDVAASEDPAVFRIKTYTDKKEGMPKPLPPSGDKGGSNMEQSSQEDEQLPAVLTGLSMNKSYVTLEVGKTCQLEAVPTYSSGKKTDWMVYWKSSASEVAGVSAYGEVTAKKPGKTEIVVYNGDIKATCVVKVKPGETKFSSISLTKDGMARFKWKRVEGVTGYKIYRATSPNGVYTRVKIIKNPNTVKAELKAVNGTKPYYYKIRAYKKVAGGIIYGDYSGAKSGGPSKVKGVKTKALKNHKVCITYTKTTRADGYVVYRATTKNGDYKRIGTVKEKNAFTFTDTTVKKGKTYYYKMRAYKLINGKKVYGSFSDKVSVRTK